MSERNQGKNNEYDTGDLHTVCACGDDPASDPAFPVSEGRVTSNITVIVLPNKVKTVASDFSSANIIQLKKGTTYKFRVRGFVKSGSKKYYGEFGKTYKLKTNK